MLDGMLHKKVRKSLPVQCKVGGFSRRSGGCEPVRQPRHPIAHLGPPALMGRPVRP
jgi:hypothetical protein